MTCPSGLGESARLMARAVRRLGLPAWAVDLQSPLGAAGIGVAAEGDHPPQAAPLLLHVNAPTLPLALLRLPHAVVRNRRRVGCWAWELPTVPPEWRSAGRLVHEIWVPSRFTAHALEPLMPGRVRVVPPPLGLMPPVPAVLDRAAFGLQADAVVVLVSFNLASSFARKNPLAAINAFRQAFGNRRDRILILKVGRPDHAPADFARLLAEATAPNIRVMTQTLPDADRHALTSACDIVLSLHRSEGFGLVPAEAMLMGKPVVATAWSGNLEYMTEANSALVRCRLIPAEDDRAVYRHGHWADPDIAEAAAWLRHLADNVDARRGMGHRAQETVRRALCGSALRSALRGLGFPVEAPPRVGGRSIRSQPVPVMPRLQAVHAVESPIRTPTRHAPADAQVRQLEPLA